MKNKLQALIAEQKALTAKIEKMINAIEYCEFNPEVLSTTEESSTLDPKKVYIKGHATRGAEVIKMLEDLGGANRLNYSGTDDKLRYYIRDDGQIYLFLNSPLHDYTELHLPEEVSEVHPPAEEVELIEGEVYNVYGNIVIFKNKRANLLHTIAIYRKIGSLCVDETNGYVIGSKADWIIATPEERKQIFGALEKAGKHFDKENMRLLDVEEFTLKDGDPFICKMNGKLSVEVFAYYKEPFGVVSYNNYTCTPLMPFNDQTKHLVGTTDSPDKYYKFVDK